MRIPNSNPINDRDEIICTENNGFAFLISKNMTMQMLIRERSLLWIVSKLVGMKMMKGERQKTIKITKPDGEWTILWQNSFVQARYGVEPFFENIDSYFGRASRVAGTTLSTYASNEVDILENDDNTQTENGFMPSDADLVNHCIVEVFDRLTARTEISEIKVLRDNSLKDKVCRSLLRKRL